MTTLLGFLLLAAAGCATHSGREIVDWLEVSVESRSMTAQRARVYCADGRYLGAVAGLEAGTVTHRRLYLGPCQRVDVIVDHLGQVCHTLAQPLT